MDNKSLLFLTKRFIQRLKNNYSPIEKDEESFNSNSATNTFNTFNTFWKGVERYVSHEDKKKSDIITEYGNYLYKIEGNSEKYIENSDNKSTLSF